jgi:uncharacterized protein YbaR (Trm112 family)
MTKEEKKRAYDKQYCLDHKEERKEYRKKWYENHKEKQKEYNKQWALDHKEERKEYRLERKEEQQQWSKQYYLGNKEEINKRSKEWRRNNPEKVRAGSAKRRARLAGVVTNPICRNFLKYLIEIYENKCAYCNETSKTYHLDHFIPIELDGHHAEYNLVLACPTCNCSKGWKDPWDWIYENNIDFIVKPYMDQR